MGDSFPHYALSCPFVPGPGTQSESKTQTWLSGATKYFILYYVIDLFIIFFVTEVTHPGGWPV